MSTKSQLDVNDVKVDVSNLDKVFYPKTGFTKREVIDYYIRISPWLLPHLKDRPVTLKRYPDGVEGEFFYEKACPLHRPGWLKTARVAKRDGGHIDYCVINDLPALVWGANLANLELHTFLHKTRAINRPTSVVFDLDPGPPADIRSCCRVALALKELMDSLDMKCFPKTSGSKGLQVYIPLNTATTYEKSKAFAHSIALTLEQQMPQMVLSKPAKILRAGKVFVDWSQNDDHKTTVTVYSLRAKDEPTVSTPIRWEEVEAGAREKKNASLSFKFQDVLLRTQKNGDLFAPVLELSQKLPAPFLSRGN
jgi:bifunctional non-homologous end joining protein LigD